MSRGAEATSEQSTKTVTCETMKTILLVATVAFVAHISAAPVNDQGSDPTPPHLAQAWIAESTGDGLPGKTGKESYIYEDCRVPSPTCLRGHIW